MAGAAALIVLLVTTVIFFFGSLHCYLLFRNKTTLECMSGDYTLCCCTSKQSPPPPTYSVGWKANFKEVMGDNVLLWFLPTGGGTRGAGKEVDSVELAQVLTTKDNEHV